MRKQRPLSPHLQIYQPQLTSILSITHRATGIALGLGLFPLTAWIWAIAQGEATYGAITQLYSNWLGLLCLFGWTFCFFYHLFNGLRHLAWDMGYGFELGQTYASGWLVVAASLAFTAFSWVTGLGYVWGGHSA